MSITELSAALSSLSISLPNSKLSEILSTYDADGSGDLTFVEFEAIFSSARLQSVFSSIDSDDSGLISLDELAQALKALGYKNLSKPQVKGILGKVDADGSGEISFKVRTRAKRVRSQQPKPQQSAPTTVRGRSGREEGASAPATESRNNRRQQPCASGAGGKSGRARQQPPSLALASLARAQLLLLRERSGAGVAGEFPNNPNFVCSRFASLLPPAPS
jgi:Ca2+-binding EF-hand superfamily protein